MIERVPARLKRRWRERGEIGTVARKKNGRSATLTLHEFFREQVFVPDCLGSRWACLEAMGELPAALQEIGLHETDDANLTQNQVGHIFIGVLARLLTETRALVRLQLMENKWCQAAATANLEDLCKALNNNKTLQLLNLRGNCIGDEGLKYLADTIRVNTSLTVLQLGGNDASAKSGPALCKALCENKDLQTLDLSCNSIGNVGARHLKEAITIGQLHTIVLDHNQIGDVGVKHLADALKINRTVRTLRIAQNIAGNPAMKHLAAMIEVNPSLTSLDIGDNTIGDAGVGHLSQALKVNRGLKVLDLSINKIGNRGITHLCEALLINRTLESLLMQCNEIGEAGARYLATALMKNRKLHTLDLARNFVSNVGTSHLGNMLRVNNVITRLDLTDNRIGNVGAERLVAALRFNSTIRSLELQENEEVPSDTLDTLYNLVQANQSAFNCRREMCRALWRPVHHPRAERQERLYSVSINTRPSKLRRLDVGCRDGDANALISFFKWYPGLLKQLGGLMVRYYDSRTA